MDHDTAAGVAEKLSIPAVRFQAPRSHEDPAFDDDCPDSGEAVVRSVPRPNSQDAFVLNGGELRWCEGHLNYPMLAWRVSGASKTEAIVTAAMRIVYEASATRPYGSSAVAMNGDNPPEITEESCDPSDMPE